MTIFGADYTFEWVAGSEDAKNQDWFSFSSGTNLYVIETGVAGPTLMPAPYGVAAYDSNRNVIVYVNGGWYDEYGTWELDLDTNTWSDVTHAPSQPLWSGDSTYAGHWATMTFDSTNNQMILVTMAPFKTAVAYTWNGVSGQWQSHALGTAIEGYWPSMSWDPLRSKAWIVVPGTGGWTIRSIDPSDWSVTTIFGTKEGPHAFASNIVHWQGSTALLVFGGIEGFGGFSSPQLAPYFFSNDATIFTGSGGAVSLTHANTPPRWRACLDCVVDDSNSKIYIVGGLTGDPFQPITRRDTWEGVIDDTANTITWTNLGSAPPSSLGWGIHLTAR